VIRLPSAEHPQAPWSPHPTRGILQAGGAGRRLTAVGSDEVPDSTLHPLQQAAKKVECGPVIRSTRCGYPEPKTTKRHRPSPERSLRKFRVAERLLNEGHDFTEVLRQLEISGRLSETIPRHA
jgi:hypothetical protein